MKKRILSLALVVALVAIMLTSFTLAYFTDTKEATNTFTVGNVKIELIEKGVDENGAEADWDDAVKELMPGEKGKNDVIKSVTVKNIGDNPAYMWIEVWVPANLDDGDDNSPAAPGLGNSLHFNYSGSVVETKSTYLGSKDGYNGYVHYIPATEGLAKNDVTAPLLDKVYMDKKVVNCTEHDNCLILMDGKTHYTGSWELKIKAVGIQSEGFADIKEAIKAYYEKDLTGHIW